MLSRTHSHSLLLFSLLLAFPSPAKPFGFPLAIASRALSQGAVPRLRPRDWGDTLKVAPSCRGGATLASTVAMLAADGGDGQGAGVEVYTSLGYVILLALRTRLIRSVGVDQVWDFLSTIQRQEVGHWYMNPGHHCETNHLTWRACGPRLRVVASMGYRSTLNSRP